VYVIAPTGRAALDVGGTTLYRYAGWVVGDTKLSLERLERKAMRETVRERFRSTKVLVIDEISMA
jgi:ATP-dependent DNA helicase PIF1